MNTKRAYWLRAALIALIGFLSFTQSKAGGKEIEMQAHPGYDSTSLFVEWAVYGETQPVKFVLYHAEGFKNEYNELSYYAELTPDSTMTYERGGKSMTFYLDRINYTYDVNKNATFFIKATYQDGSVKTSDLFYLGPYIEPEPEYITFVSDPKTTAKYGELYEYDVNAKSSSGSEITYSLVEAPEGATIDSETGLISWTPNAYGTFQFEVYASRANDAFNKYAQFQYWKVLVPHCEKLSKIYGEVRNKAEQLIEYGSVDLLVKVDSIGDFYLPVGESQIVKGKYEIKDVDAGSYFILVNYKEQYGRPNMIPVTVGCDENKKLDIQVTDPDINNMITITSTPVDHIKLNQNYSYDVDASAPNANLNIRYKLMQAPEGATINEATGVISWTPEKSGLFMFTVQALADENEGAEMFNAYQGWQVRVMECDNPASINLTVNYEDENKPLEMGHAYLFSKVPGDSADYLIIVGDAPIENGVVTFPDVDKGTYYVMVDDFTDGGRKDYYYQHWYENATSYENATPVVVDCGQNLNLNMTLTAPPKPNYYKISGRVTDKDGNPVENAVVQIYDDYYVPKNHEGYYSTFTDAEGKYEISAADDGNYIAVAYVMPDSSYNGSFFYMPVYYNQTTNLSEAEHIQLTGDRSDINFTLLRAPIFENSISGKITDENNSPIELSYVMLYLVEPSQEYSDWLYVGFTTTSNSDGSFKMINLIPGKYVAFSFSARNEHMVPGYYKKGFPSTLNWEDATLIELGETTQVDSINIQLGTAKGLVGVGRVEGKVYGDEKKQIVKGSGELPFDKPIVGANVYAINEQGNVAGSAQTKNDGSFFIANLNKGTYTLSIDKVGYELSNVNVTLSDDNSKSNADINIRNKPMGTGDNLELAIAKVAPNPAAETLTLNFQADGQTRITLVNSLGSKVYSANLGSLRGVSTHEINLGSYPQGSYYAIIESGLRSSTIPVIIVK